MSSQAQTRNAIAYSRVSTAAAVAGIQTSIYRLQIHLKKGKFLFQLNIYLVKYNYIFSINVLPLLYFLLLFSISHPSLRLLLIYQGMTALHTFVH